MSLQIGDSAPSFVLPGTDGHQHAYGGEDENATVVIFTCNHCPYSLAWEDRLLQLGRDYRHDGVRFLAINPNDASIKPADSFENMKTRHEENSWSFPYLRDESQEVAKAYGAKTTPDVFIFNSDNELAYRGAPDADYEDESKNASWIRDALDALLAGNTPVVQETEPVGCSVKWKV
ncbi:MAG: thioredoxin family protein [Solirubrobacterales bacterium]|nr:thioredoxin family protein [Solirubrobacterales bacterium]